MGWHRAPAFARHRRRLRRRLLAHSTCVSRATRSWAPSYWRCSSTAAVSLSASRRFGPFTACADASAVASANATMASSTNPWQSLELMRLRRERRRSSPRHQADPRYHQSRKHATQYRWRSHPMGYRSRNPSPRASGLRPRSFPSMWRRPTSWRPGCCHMAVLPPDRRPSRYVRVSRAAAVSSSAQ